MLIKLKNAVVGSSAGNTLREMSSQWSVLFESEAWLLRRTENWKQSRNQLGMLFVVSVYSSRSRHHDNAGLLTLRTRSPPTPQ